MSAVWRWDYKPDRKLHVLNQGLYSQLRVAAYGRDGDGNSYPLDVKSNTEINVFFFLSLHSYDTLCLHVTYFSREPSARRGVAGWATGRAAILLLPLLL